MLQKINCRGLTPKDIQLLLKRPGSASDVEVSVKAILDQVKVEGDKAVIELNGKYGSSVQTRNSKVNLELKKAIRLAASNIEKFHRSQQYSDKVVNVMPGVRAWRKAVPIERVGLYIPGGSAPLFSTVLMLGIPAKIAGCKEVILCTPPDVNGNIDPAILYAAKVAGIKKIFK